MTESPLVTAFRASTLPQAAWTHEAHLRVGLWHVLAFGRDEAMRRLREGIVALNDAHGTPNTDERGYHETITWAYVQLLAALVDEHPAGTPLEMLADAAITRFSDSRVLLRYYSETRLRSVEARCSAVTPDLRALA